MAASGVKPFYIGGPATTGLYQNWIIDLYNFCGNKGLRLDFLSWHRYSMDPTQYFRDVSDIYFWLAGKPIPQLVISEWGPTPEKSNLYSSQYAGVYSLAAARQLLDSVSLITVFEIKDGPASPQGEPGQAGSGWGLLGHENSGLTPKPRYSAFQWLAGVTGKRLQMSGEGSNVTGWAAKDGEKISIWLVNFGNAAIKEIVPIEIRNLTPGKWQLTKEVMFGKKETMDINLQTDVLQTSLGLDQNQAGRMILIKIQD
jgi:hypothetical protein